MSVILTADELASLTGYKKAACQRQVLEAQGIPYKRIGNRNIVMSQHVVAWAEGRPVRASVGVNFSAVS